jgi:DNA-binding CsgD family transcriptional regulator
MCGPADGCQMRKPPKTIRRPRSHPAETNGLLLPVNPGEDFLSGGQWVDIANAVHITTREMVVAAYLLQGLTRKAIAHRLKVSPETIRVHIDQLFHKLRVKDRLGVALRIARLRDSLSSEMRLPRIVKRPKRDGG